MIKKMSVALGCALFFSCHPQNPGSLTLVNSGVEPIKVLVDGRAFNIRPSNHITKEIAEGAHEIAIGDQTQTVQVAAGRTTLFDSTGLSCFVVADFSERYRGGSIKIVEKFFREQVFMTKDGMTAILGSYLPKKPPPEKPVLRIQQVDCDSMNDDSELAQSLRNIP